MNKNIKFINNLQSTIIKHLQSTMKKIGKVSIKANKETKIFLNFFENLQKIFSTFQVSIQKLIDDFKNQKKECISDSKLKLIFELILSKIIQYNTEKKLQQEEVEQKMMKMTRFHKEFISIISVIQESIKSNLFDIKQKYEKCQLSYDTYINEFKKQQFKNKQESNIQKLGKVQQLYLFEEQSVQQHQQFRQLLTLEVERVNKLLDSTKIIEQDLKNNILHTSEQIIQDYYPDDKLTSHQFEEVTKSIKTFTIWSQKLQKEVTLDFEENLHLELHHMRFWDFTNFCFYDKLCRSNYMKFILNKIQLSQEDIQPQKVIFTEILLEQLYNTDKKIDKKHLNMVFKLIQNSNTIEFFIYNMIWKKSCCRISQPASNLILSEKQIKNFMQISQYFFIIQASEDQVNFELVYHYLKFCLLIQDVKGESISIFLYKQILFQEQNFWLELYQFLIGYLQVNSKSKDKSNKYKEGQDSSKIFGFLKYGKSNSDKKQMIQNKAFEEISSILFRAKLDFEHITNILIQLARRASIKFENVEKLLQKNSFLFETQIHNEEKIDYKVNNTTKLMKTLSKEQKIYQMIKKIIPFVNESQKILIFTRLNKKSWKLRYKIMKNLLIHQIKDIDFRLFLIQECCQSNFSKNQLRNDFEKIQKEQNLIIDLDVKRTFNDKIEFDKETLKKILKNISHPNMGDFSYYQGLNYVTSYFFLLFNKDEIKTYNVVINLLYSKFSRYIDKELIGLKKIFFFIKKIMRSELVTLMDYLENDLKLNLDIILAQWCLTIFTICIQYNEKSYLLDQIVDIFIAQGWNGFIKVVLVLFSELEEHLLKLDYENVLLFLNELPRNNFEKIIENNDYFDIKIKIKKYNQVNNTYIATLGSEYSMIQERIESFWFKLSQQIKMHSNLS